MRNPLRRNRPAPPEYLCIDQSRLDDYLGAISSTTTRGRAPSLGFSAFGLSAHIAGTAPPREKSRHEKVTELIRYLERHGHLSHDRPCVPRSSDDDLAPAPFVLEICDAVPVIIPAAENTGPGAMMWVSEWPLDQRQDALRRPGLLCMIEDASRDDGQHRPCFSSYTWLLALLHQLRLQPRPTALAARYVASHGAGYSFDIMTPLGQLLPAGGVFRPHPLRWLEAQGCQVGLSRRVHALYRIRAASEDEIGTKNRTQDFTISTFSYAIAIWAST